MLNRPLHGQKLQLSAVVIDLCTMQCPAPKSYGMVPSIRLFLCLGSITSCIFMQGVCNPGEVLNKVPVVPNKSDKTLNGSVHGRFRVFCDGLQVIPAQPYPFQRNTISQVLNFLEEFTLGRLKFQPVELEALQHGL